MFKNYLITVLCGLFKNKFTFFINITCLTLGMAGAIVLLLNIQHECNADEFHTNKDNLYFTYSKVIFPEIKAITRMAAAEKMVSGGEKKRMSDASHADPSFLHMFSFPLLHGDLNTALEEEHSMVATEQFASRLDLLYLAGSTIITKSLFSISLASVSPSVPGT